MKKYNSWWYLWLLPKTVPWKFRKSFFKKERKTKFSKPVIKVILLFLKGYKDLKIVVKEGDELSLNKHFLHFIRVSKIDWHEIIFTYKSYTKTLLIEYFFNIISNKYYSWKKLNINNP